MIDNIIKLLQEMPDNEFLEMHRSVDQSTGMSLEQFKIHQSMAYVQGIIAGLEMYAHWHDGVQYVGTCGKTLKDAINEIKTKYSLDSL